MVKEYKYLTSEQVGHFLEHGWVLIPSAFTLEKANEFTHDVWVRLGYDKDDKSTWAKERIHMPHHHREPTQTFAPKAWGAMCELLGGEDRVDPKNSTWGNSLIVNLGTEENEDGKGEDKVVNPKNLNNWHVDGDFFVHFLDSPEQALLVVPLFSDIAPRGGGTYISPDGINLVAKYLASHPEGVLPTGLSFTPQFDPTDKFDHLEKIHECSEFAELTGKTGDVILMHPLMLHSASINHTRVPRLITNPPVSLLAPFNFARDDPEEYSLVEKKTLRALGVEKLDFKITSERKRIVPARVVAQNKMMREELERLEKARKEGTLTLPQVQSVGA